MTLNNDDKKIKELAGALQEYGFGWFFTIRAIEQILNTATEFGLEKAAQIDEICDELGIDTTLKESLENTLPEVKDITLKHAALLDSLKDGAYSQN